MNSNNSSETLVDLLIGGTLHMRVSNFLSQNECFELVNKIDQIGIKYYRGDNKNRQEDTKGKLGPNFFRYRFERSKYAELTQRYATIFSDNLFSNNNLFNKLTHFIESHTGCKVHYPLIGNHNFQNAQ